MVKGYLSCDLGSIFGDKDRRLVLEQHYSRRFLFPTEKASQLVDTMEHCSRCHMQSSLTIKSVYPTELEDRIAEGGDHQTIVISAGESPDVLVTSLERNRL